jgi:hypothetical protein
LTSLKSLEARGIKEPKMSDYNHARTDKDDGDTPSTNHQRQSNGDSPPDLTNITPRQVIPCSSSLQKKIMSAADGISNRKRFSAKQCMNPHPLRITPTCHRGRQCLLLIIVIGCGASRTTARQHEGGGRVRR